MKQAKTAAERDRIRNAHHADMQQRAKERGVTLPEQPRSRATKAGRSGEGRGPRGGAGG
jgi:1,2-phenylacetyl-CoA epoxidase catalytic subunit